MDAVAIVDCNSFYASCERVFRPELADKPVVVLSNNDGCIVARSSEVKALGIPNGSPLFKVENIVRREKVHVFSSNYTLYGDLSRRVMEALALFSPDIEVYSIDEAFLNLRGFERRGLAEYGRVMRDTVERWTGIPVSVGIAETKTLAKIANRLSKRSPKTRGVLDLTESVHRERALAITPVGGVWGVGRRYARFLERYGIRSALDFARAEDGWVRKHMTVVGLRTVRELRGIPSIEMDDAPPPKQQICVSRSFGRPVTECRDMEEAVASYVTRAAEKLRRQHSAAGSILVFMTTNRFRDDPQYVGSTIAGLPVQTDCTRELLGYALPAARRIFREGYRFKKAGVVLGDIRPADEAQADLFDTLDRGTSRRLMTALDTVNSRFGKGTVAFAAEGIEKPWRTKFEKRSPRYTTRWEDLPIVRA